MNNLDYNRLMDAARQRAIALRREAIQNLWRDLGAAPAETLRAARRLAQRMARHAHGHTAPAHPKTKHLEA